MDNILRWLSLLTFMSLLSVYSAQDLDVKVVIGLSINDTTDLYSFNENYGREFEIPIVLYVYNRTTGDPIDVSPPSPVRVTCETTPDELGYSQAVFGEKDIIDGEGVVDFMDPTAGRPSELRCFEFDGTNETKLVSLSNPVTFAVRPAGTVYIAQPNIIVCDSGNAFYVELSEEAERSDVNVTCEVLTGLVPVHVVTTTAPPVTEPGTPFCFPCGKCVPSLLPPMPTPGSRIEVNYIHRGQMNLSFAEITIRVGQRLALVPYSVTDRGIDVEVVCTARSLGQPLQFDPLTSTGSGGVFSLHEYIMTMEPSRAEVFSTELMAKLIFNQCPCESCSPVTSIVVNCSLVMVQDSAHAQQIINSPTCVQPPSCVQDTVTAIPTTPSSAPAQPVCSPWTYNIPDNGNDDIVYDVILTRGSEVTEETSELFVLSCCATDNDLYSKATLVVASHQSPLLNTSSGDAGSPTTILNPAFVELSPCACDLQNVACDVNCCCDQECLEEDIATFECIEGLYGGNFSAPPEYMCNSNYPAKSDWFYVLCVQLNNSAYFGSIHYEPTSADIGEQEPYSPKESDKQFAPEQGYAAEGYQEGEGIKTAINTSTLFFGSNYRLTLPKPSLGGVCVDSPVRFLQPSVSSCSWRVSEELCQAYSPWSAYSYAQADHWTAPKGPVVLSTPGGNGKINITNVNFLCTNSTSGMITPVRELPPEESCTFDFLTGAYRCENTTFEEPDFLVPSRCDFDAGGFASPPAPTFDAARGICMDVVTSVLYNFTWSGSELVKLDATIILSDILMSGEYDELSQVYEVMFYHEMNETLAEEQSQSYRERSGNPGYEYGLPVFSGIPQFDNETVLESFTYIDTNTSNRLATWNPGLSGLCSDAGHQDLKFRVNNVGSCFVELDAINFQSCHDIRRLALWYQDSLMQSALISMGGDPNFTLAEPGWIPVFRQDIQYIIMNNDSNTTSLPLTTEMSLVTELNNKTELFNSSLLGECESLSGCCDNIPTAINLNIMYAMVGQRDANPIYQIIGAKISYVLADWRYRCDAGLCPVNTSDSGFVKQRFQLTSYVKYIEVPPKRPKAKTSYEASTESRVNKCAGDACWNEIFYPFLEINPGDSYQYTTGLGLLCLFFIIGLFMVSLPISRWDYIHPEL